LTLNLKTLFFDIYSILNIKYAILCKELCYTFSNNKEVINGKSSKSY
jgi:hypothetical protein